MLKALTIAGFDPSGGAGIQADLKVFRHFRVYGLSAVAALTVQNSSGVVQVRPVNSVFVEKQLSNLLADFTPDTAKTGMLLTEDNVSAVAGIIREYGLPNIVVDPVILSSTGRRLADRGVPDLIRGKLLPVCTVITPNLYEASVLTGTVVSTKAEMQRAAAILHDLGCRNVIITGGHCRDGFAEDLVFDGEFHYLKSRKLAGEYHGTGCAFSSATASLLARGMPLLEAARQAKKFVNMKLRSAFSAGGPMRLLDL